MSAERFDRIESQLTQVIQGMAIMQQNVEDKHNLLVQIMTSGFTSLNRRVDTIETSLNHLSQQVNDINIDLTTNEQKIEDNAHKTRRIN
jgi:predicted  nucleic acid-binding Zn-ribbon protein